MPASEIAVNQVLLADCAFVPWRNGGGRTRELLAWPTPQHWLVRVSVAEIEADGLFSAFDGVDRCFAVLHGAGVVLSLPRGEVRLHAGDPALGFPGEAAPLCRLIDGPTRDLNLMTRRSAGRGTLRRDPAPGPVPGPAQWRGLFADDTLWWSDDAHEALPRREGWHLSLHP